MFRVCKFLPLFLAVATISVFLREPAEAGPISRLLREAGETAGDAGKRLDTPSSRLDDGVFLTKKLPSSGDSASVALLPAENGSWLLVTSEGTQIPLSSLDKLPGTLDDVPLPAARQLAGDANPANSKRAKSIQIAVRERDYFKVKEQLTDLPPNAVPMLVRPGGKSFRLRPAGTGPTRILAVELGPDILINPATARALDGNLKFLSRPVNKANLKIGRFDSAAAKSGPPNPGNVIADLDADILESSLSSFKNRTLAISGQIRRHPDTSRAELLVRDGKTVRTIDLTGLQVAAERQRVNLMIVESAAPVQPGKTWFSKSALEKQFPGAQAAITQSELIRALSPRGSTILITAADERNYRLVMSTSYGHNTASPSSAGGSGYSAPGWFLDAALRSSVRSISSNHEDPDHSDEVESRWIPWISNLNLIVSAFLVFGGLFLSWYLWKWWDGLWCYAARKAGGREAGPVLRIVKLLVFVPFAAVMAVPALFWIAVVDWLKFLSWPFRKAFGK